VRLTIIKTTHVDDVEWPLTPDDLPARFVTGDRDVLWAEDELGRTWQKAPGETRWYPCSSFATSPTPRAATGGERGTT
jgi:hypothetical protein